MVSAAVSKQLVTDKTKVLDFLVCYSNELILELVVLPTVLSAYLSPKANIPCWYPRPHPSIHPSIDVSTANVSICGCTKLINLTVIGLGAVQRSGGGCGSSGVATATESAATLARGQSSTNRLGLQSAILLILRMTKRVATDHPSCGAAVTTRAAWAVQLLKSLDHRRRLRS